MEFFTSIFGILASFLLSAIVCGLSVTCDLPIATKIGNPHLDSLFYKDAERNGKNKLVLNQCLRFLVFLVLIQFL